MSAPLSLAVTRVLVGVGPMVVVRVVGCTFARLARTLIKNEESARDNHVLDCDFAKYSPILKFVGTRRLSNKSFLIWLLTTPSHLKYVATLPCNLSLSACFADINASQGSVATYARCGGIFSTHPFNCKFT